MFFLEQQSFLNCAIQVKCNLEKQQLSKQLKNIEHLLGRKRDKSNVNAPRTIDLDVICMFNYNFAFCCCEMLYVFDC